jgi:hypothetical protein
MTKQQACKLAMPFVPPGYPVVACTLVGLIEYYFLHLRRIGTAAGNFINEKP